MGSFSEQFFDLFIFVATIGGIFALFVFLAIYSGGSVKENPETMGHKWDGDLEEYNNPLPRWWNIMFYITLAFGVVYLLLYPGLGSNSMLLGWTQVKQYEEEMAAAEKRYAPLFERYAGTAIPTLADDPEARKIGGRLYLNYCAQCHGSDAGGARGFPSLVDADWQWGGEPETIKATILNGRQGIMTPWGEQLESAGVGVEAMVEYVLALAGREHDAAAAGKARAFYETPSNCAACHGAHGSGNPALGAPDLTDDVWLYGGSRGAIEHTLAHGRHGVMPAFGEFLGEAKVHLLAAYVYGKSRE